MKAITSLLLGAFLSVSSVAIAAGWTTDPVVGTWKLNVGKSKFIHGPALKSDTRIYEETADGMLKVTLRSVSADGNEFTLIRSFRQDGKDYPVNDASGVDRISEIRTSTRIAEYAEKKGHKTMLSGRRRVLSKDGRTLTDSERGTDPTTGTEVERTLVYDRQ